VNFVSPLGQRFQHVRAGRGGLSNPHVSAILEDRRGGLWVGTDPGGLNRLDRGSGAFRYYRSRPDDPTTIGSDAVNALYEDSQGRIWLGGWDGGLGRIDPATGRVTRYRHDPDDPTTIGSNHVWSIQELRGGEMLIGTWHGADLFDRATSRFTRLVARYPAAGTVGTYATAEDARGNLWLARSNGALHIDRATGRVTSYQNDPKDRQSLGAGLVQTVRVDSAGNVWLGTGYGLNCLPRGASRMRRYTVEDGLPHDSVTGILEDGAGNLWLGTSRGLVQFQGAVRVPEKPTLRVFDMHDGLQGYEFVRNASFRGPSGEMYFGGPRGLNRFFPDRIERNTTPPPVVLTGLRILNRPVRPGAAGSPLARQLADTESLTLSHRDSVITVEFAALNYLLPQKNRYSHKLVGFDEDWSEAGRQRASTYTNLSPGAYTFRVIASNNDGVWNEEGAALRVRITPPFWGTWWFRSVAAVALVAASASWYRGRIRAAHGRRRELEALVEQRTAALSAEVAEHERTEAMLAGEVREHGRAEEEAREAAARLAASNAELFERRTALEREVVERRRATRASTGPRPGPSGSRARRRPSAAPTSTSSRPSSPGPRSRTSGGSSARARP
jgi:streptogramin lyase